MFFLVLNAFICGLLIAFSFAVDSDKKAKAANTALINSILFLATLFGFMAVTLFLNFFAPSQLTILVAKVLFILMAWFSISCCYYLLNFPNHNRSKASKIIQWVLNFFAAYIVFFVPGAITNVSVTYNNYFTISSNHVFSGEFANVIKITWMHLFAFVYVFIIPLFFVLMALVRADHSKPLLRQRILISCAGTIGSWFLFAFIFYGCKFQPMLSTLFLCGFIVQVVAFFYAIRSDEIWDKKFVLRNVINFLLNFFFPAALVGLFFTLSWPLFARDKFLFLFLFVVQSGIIITLWYFLLQYAEKKGFLNDNRYAAAFTNEITSLDFDQEQKRIPSKLFNSFKKYVDTSFMKVLIDSEEGYFNVVYDSTSENNNVVQTVEKNTEIFEVLLNLKKRIVFREGVGKIDYTLQQLRIPILAFMDSLNADAFILLSEGNHILGLIVLGKKCSGNPYNSYDIKTFTSLYSSFFVIGYYMKNIMNESVIGTVDREIKMSSQIITSLQENMDFVHNPKVDVSYLMIPARTIGGEFVDMIRLTDSRYIYIIGALSGKGIAASMSMVIMKSIIRTFLAETKDFKLLITKVNEFIRECLPKGTFFAGTFGLIDFSTDTMYYINCGSAVLFLYTRAYNNVIEIQGEGRVLGFAKSVKGLLKVKKVKLSPGDIVFSCTDGLIDSRSLRGEKFGKARLQNEIMENYSYPASRMNQFMYDELVKFSSKGLQDDVTMLMLKYLSLTDTEEGGAK